MPQPPQLDLRSFDAVVFDMDGTLVDSEDLYCQACIHAMEVLGGTLSREDYYLRIAGQSEPLIDDIFFADLDGRVEKDEARSVRVNEFERLRDTVGVPALPGVHPLLDILDSLGLAVGVASAAGLSDIEGNLRSAGIWERFKVIASSEEVPDTKPAPDVYLLAAERLTATPSRCLAFEDTNSGARAAIAAGMHTCMVPHHCAPDEFVIEHGQGVFASLAEVVECFNCRTSP